MNGKLDAVVLTITTRPGSGRSSAGPVRGIEIGPDQVELGIDAVERPVANQHDQQQVVARHACGRSAASTRRTFAAVATRSPARAVSDSTVTAAGSNRRFSTRVEREIAAPAAVLRRVLLPSRRARHDERKARLRGRRATRRMPARRRSAEPPAELSHVAVRVARRT